VDDLEIAVHANESPAQRLEEGADAVEDIIGAESRRRPLL
jgi:hypothetical protein